MKLSETLTPEATTALIAAKEALKKPLASLEAHCKTQNGLCEKMKRLQKEHAELENKAAGGSRKASLEIHALIDQKSRLSRTIEVGEENAHVYKEPLREAANNAQVALAPVIRDLQTQIEDEIEHVLAPYWTDKSWARAAGRGCDASRALGIHFNGSLGASAVEFHAAAAKFLGLIEAVLAGGEIWSFK